MECMIWREASHFLCLTFFLFRLLVKTIINSFRWLAARALLLHNLFWALANQSDYFMFLLFFLAFVLEDVDQFLHCLLLVLNLVVKELLWVSSGHAIVCSSQLVLRTVLYCGVSLLCKSFWVIANEVGCERALFHDNLFLFLLKNCYLILHLFFVY